MMLGGPNPVRNHDGIISAPLPNYMPDSKGIGYVIFDKMMANKDHVAQIDGITGEEDSNESLLQRSVRTAISMQSRGVLAHDVVAICSYNHLDTCVPYIAGLFLCARVSCLDPELGLADSVHILNMIRPKIIFVGLEAVRLIENALEEAGLQTRIVVFGPSTIHEKFSEFLIPSADEETFRPTQADNIRDTAIIFFSAGTTGLPKGVCLSHRAVLMQTTQFPQSFPCISLPSFSRTQLTFASLYWISTSTVLLMCVFHYRSRVIFPRFELDDFWSLLERSKVESILIAPSHVQKVCIKGKPEKLDISNLKQVFITGGPVSKEQILDLQNLLPKVIILNIYGITECGGYTMCFKPHLYPEERQLLRQKPDSCGRPRTGIACKIVDNETGEILGPHQRGELRIKTEFQMSGYCNVDSSACWDSDGYFKTGEVAYYDEDNCFFIVDRMRDMLKFRSWYVAPAKLEGILHAHPAVATAVVVGLPHPEDGDHPVGVVVLRPSAVGSVTAEDIQYYVDQRVDDKHKLRGGVRIVDYIPVTPTGKNRRRDMREKVLRGEI